MIAWPCLPDPDDHRSGLEFWKKQGLCHRSDPKRSTAFFFKTVQEWSLFRYGPINFGYYASHGAQRRVRHLRENQLEDAFSMVVMAVEQLDNPHEAVLYTSGRASNEAAFFGGLWLGKLNKQSARLWQYVSRTSGMALSQAIGIGKGTVKLDCFNQADLV